MKQEPELISSVRCSEMWNRVSLRVVLATGALGTTVLHDLRIKINLIVSKNFGLFCSQHY